jgi:hypothetical protein
LALPRFCRSLEFLPFALEPAMKFASLIAPLALAAVLAIGMPARSADAPLNTAPEGFTLLFNGKDLTGWTGLPLKQNAKDPAKLSPMTMPERLSASPEDLAAAKKRGDESAHQHWKVENGIIVFDGKGQNLCTDRDYGNFELYVDWKIEKDGDSGIYLRGTPQIQIWDPAVKPAGGVGSGGIYNNKENPNKPTANADNPVGQWNTFYIKMVGDKVTVKLNDKIVVDNVTMENFWERDKPLYATGTIELQNHGNTLYFRNIYIRELSANP